MNEHLMVLAEQNERILTVLEQISDKLDALSSVEFAVESLSREVGEIKDELQWHKHLSFASQLIASVNGVTEAVSKEP